jgi:transcriptional regulator with XRE-family HTH domain
MGVEMDDAEILKKFGQNIARIRQERGFSQEHLADLAGLDRTYISSLERGKRNVGLLNVVRISGALSASSSEVFSGVLNA